MDSLLAFETGLGMLTGLIVIVLGLVLSQNSLGSKVWLQTGRKISLLGAVLFAASAVIYGVFR